MIRTNLLCFFFQGCLNFLYTGDVCADTSHPFFKLWFLVHQGMLKPHFRFLFLLFATIVITQKLWSKLTRSFGAVGSSKISIGLSVKLRKLQCIGPEYILGRESSFAKYIASASWPISYGDVKNCAKDDKHMCKQTCCMLTRKPL